MEVWVLVLDAMGREGFHKTLGKHAHMLGFTTARLHQELVDMPTIQHMFPHVEITPTSNLVLADSVSNIMSVYYAK